MKKGLVILLVVGAVLVGLFFWFQGNYNNMVKMDEGVQAAWSQVENVYQRRADLIPNLVATVKGYAAHEQQTLEGVVSARSKATQITVDAENLTPEEELAKLRAPVETFFLKRDRGAGRPTKKDRRQMDELWSNLSFDVPDDIAEQLADYYEKMDDC